LIRLEQFFLCWNVSKLKKKKKKKKKKRACWCEPVEMTLILKSAKCLENNLAINRREFWEETKSSFDLIVCYLL
jgi:hypothetical protein